MTILVVSVLHQILILSRMDSEAIKETLNNSIGTAKGKAFKIKHAAFLSLTDPILLLFFYQLCKMSMKCIKTAHFFTYAISMLLVILPN